jgi:hypothetical protein
MLFLSFIRFFLFLFFCRNFLSNTSNVEGSYYFKVSTYNANHLLVEAPQCSPSPIIRDPNPFKNEQIILFLEQFHLQFPLDNLEDKSYIILEWYENRLNANGKDTAATTTTTTTTTPATGSATPSTPTDSALKAWGKIVLDRNALTSEKLQLSLYGPPVNTVTITSQVHSTLDIDFIITKRT